MIVVYLSKALLCFSTSCVPILYGRATPTGDFPLHHVKTTLKGYGGDVVVYREDPKRLWALHRVWLGSPKQRRLERLDSETPADNIISSGCINMYPEDYEQLVKAIEKDGETTLHIRP